MTPNEPESTTNIERSTCYVLSHQWPVRQAVSPWQYRLTHASYCVNHAFRPKYVYEHFTASDDLRLSTSQNDVSANPNSTRRQPCKVNDRIHGADVCRLSRLRKGAGLSLGEDATDQEF